MRVTAGSRALSLATGSADLQVRDEEHRHEQYASTEAGFACETHLLSQRSERITPRQPRVEDGRQWIARRRTALYHRLRNEQRGNADAQQRCSRDEKRPQPGLKWVCHAPDVLRRTSNDEPLTGAGE